FLHSGILLVVENLAACIIAHKRRKKRAFHPTNKGPSSFRVLSYLAPSLCTVLHALFRCRYALDLLLCGGNTMSRTRNNPESSVRFRLEMAPTIGVFVGFFIGLIGSRSSIPSRGLI